ncbi:hypothetical protein [Microbispora sp. NPDC049633]|uniref:hypothetical protein n=1 Tax=Microbispora sp. NPDC049633 TaxID=3154355 RepID=UPI00342CFE2A
MPDLEPAEKAGLIRLTGPTLAFRHPLVRAAAYHGATLAGRIAVHQALVTSLDGDEHADRRAWHRAAAATGADEQAALELERAAERATGGERPRPRPARPGRTGGRGRAAYRRVRGAGPPPRHDIVARYERWAQLTSRPATLALASRCRALTSPDEQAEDHFTAALDHHEQGLERSRTHLLYGEWLVADAGAPTPGVTSGRRWKPSRGPAPPPGRTVPERNCAAPGRSSTRPAPPAPCSAA